MFMANLSSADPIYDEAGPSYDSNILSEVQDHDNYLDTVGVYHAAHEMQNDVQQNYVVDSNVEYTSDSNIIPYEQYVKNNAEHVVQSNVSSVRNDALMMIINDMHKQAAQFKTNHAPAVVHDSEDTLELAEITRKEMLEKMKIPLLVKNKIKIAPPDYSKENYIATFTPQRQLSAEQIFLSFILKPISKMTVYPPNTPAKLVPMVLPTKTEVEQHAVDKKCVEIERKNLLIENENLIVDCLYNELLYSIKNSVNTVSRFSKMHDAYTVEQARNVELEVEISKLKHKLQKDNHSEMIKHFSKLEVDHLNLQMKYQHLKERFGNKKSQTSQDAPEFDSFFEINKMKEQLQGKDNTIRKLKVQISHTNERQQNVRFRVENEKVKQHYKELYDYIKITCAKTIEKTSSLLTENEKLKAQLKGKIECVTMNIVKPKVLALGMYAIDVEPIPPHNRNNREVHLDYLKHSKESVEILREIVEEARIEKPLDNAPGNSCFYTKRSQELLEYVIGTCSKEFCKRDKKKGVNSSTEASGSKPRRNTKNNRMLPAKSNNKKKVEDHPRNNKSKLKQENRVNSSISHKRTWKPTRKKFTLGEQRPLTRLTKSKVVPLQQPQHVSTSEIIITERFSNITQKPLARYKCRNKKEKVSTGIPTTAETQTINAPVVQIVLLYLDSGCSKHMTGNRSRINNFVKKFIGTVRFRNDHFGAIMGYGDYMISNSVISKVYYVEGLGHNLFSVGKYCDSDLEVAFRKDSCYVKDVDGVELLKGNRGSNLYTISVEDMMKSSLICLLLKASKNKSWLWHHWLNHLNFDTINDLARKDLVRGLPRLKFEKDHLCSACQLGKRKKYTHKPKSENTIMEVLHTLHMDLCGPIRVQSINGKRYILVIVDDYSRFAWVKFLRSNDKTPEFVIKILKQIPVGLNRTNGIVERWNRTLVEAAQTMLIFSKALMFLWAEVVATHMAPVHINSGPEPILMTPGQISSGLIPNPVPAAPYVPPTNKDLEILFQLMFDEYFEPPSIERHVPPAHAVQVLVVSAAVCCETAILDSDLPLEILLSGLPSGLSIEYHSGLFKPLRSSLSKPLRSGLSKLLHGGLARLPIGKRNLLMDLQKMQKNPIFRISVDILQNTNFFRAFTASTDVPSIYIQQFWNTLGKDFKTSALGITPKDSAYPFVPPLVGDLVIDFVNNLGYPEELQFVSKTCVNSLYQLWRTILSMINQYLTGKTSGGDRPRHPVLQMLWGVVTRTNVPTKKPKSHVIPYCRFTKLIIYYLGSRHNIHIRHQSPVHITTDDYPLGNLKFVSKGRVDEVFGMPIPKDLISEEVEKKKKAIKASKSTHPAPAKQPKPMKNKTSKPTPSKKIHKGKSLESLQAPIGGVVVRELNPGFIRKLPEVEGKGKGIVIDEQATQSLLDLHKLKKQSIKDQYIFQRRTPVTQDASTGPSAQPRDDISAKVVHDTSSPADSTNDVDIVTDMGQSNKERTVELDEGQAGSDPGKTPDSRPPPEREYIEEDQAGSDPGQSHVAQDGRNPKPMHEDFIATVYPKVHESLKLTIEE
ncbi:retrovirus-related pol polyprotein from transposon TNT 1-94 [Tanacetum coccineum]|uniref:Retrovirus-related pol polyprotein from transposon TNT 1-94 n=1 Tax=Tanacetum coccineum TaxID=301880 RepID=A0ABQ5C1R2_9ASTR